jgi:hypothetical protein
MKHAQRRAAGQKEIDVRVFGAQAGGPQGKLGDAEIVFLTGAFVGLKIVGFAIWQGQHGPAVTLPARMYMVGQQKRYYHHIQAVVDREREAQLKKLIVSEYLQQIRPTSTQQRKARKGKAAA